jgi:ClpP class serine protease
MATWEELLHELNHTESKQRDKFFNSKLAEYLDKIVVLRNRNVMVYSSAFLQKPQVPPFFTMLTMEDINGFMSNLKGMDFSKGLTLILHTPGGVMDSVEPIVSYLREKFSYIEVVIPTYSMSAGTMIALSADKILMGRQSQLGQIEPQIPLSGGRTIVSTALLQQFDRAKKEIIKDPKVAYAWTPILKSFGPALLQQAENALEYSKTMVEEFLKAYMFKNGDNSKISNIVNTFTYGSNGKNNHGRRIDKHEARDLGLVIEEIEQTDDLQDAVLSVYHLTTLIFETTLATKIITSSHGKRWIKSLPPAQ